MRTPRVSLAPLALVCLVIPVALAGQEPQPEWRGENLQALDPDGAFTLVDLRPLRPLAHQNMVPELTDDMKRLLFVADAALLIRGGHTGSYDIVRRTSVPR